MLDFSNGFKEHFHKSVLLTQDCYNRPIRLVAVLRHRQLHITFYAEEVTD